VGYSTGKPPKRRDKYSPRRSEEAHTLEYKTTLTVRLIEIEDAQMMTV